MLNVETTWAYRVWVLVIFLAGLLVGMLSLQGEAEAQENTKENGPIVASEWDGISPQTQIVKIDSATDEKSPIPGAFGTNPSVTPDGKTVIYRGQNEATTEFYGDLYAVPIDGSTAPTRIQATVPALPQNTSKEFPVVSPDGQKVYFQLRYQNDAGIFGSLASVPIAGGDVTEITTNDPAQYFGLTITPDGQNLVWDDTAPGGNSRRIITMPVQGGTKHFVALANDSPTSVPNSCWGQRISQPTVSADGQTVAMRSQRNCNLTVTGSLPSLWTESAIYTVPFSTTTTSTPVMLPGTETRSGGNTGTPPTGIGEPAYSPDGQLLAYNVVHTSSDGTRSTDIRAVPVSGGTSTVIVPSASNKILQGSWWAARSSQVEEVLEVKSTNPASGDTEVEKETNPTAEFNLNLDPRTVNGESVKLEVWNDRKKRWVPVSSTPSYDDDSKTISVNPEETLGTQKQYQVTLSTAIKSSTGKELASPHQWSFTTEK